MKKLFGILMIAGMISFVACGPSGNEQASEEQVQTDSLKNESNVVIEDEQLNSDTIQVAQTDTTVQVDTTATN